MIRNLLDLLALFKNGKGEGDISISFYSAKLCTLFCNVEFGPEILLSAVLNTSRHHFAIYWGILKTAL